MWNHKPELLYPDILLRKNSLAPRVDLYVTGFPCQPFSPAGANKGTRDPNGTLFEACLSYIKAKLPTIVVLENVLGLLHRHCAAYNRIVRELEGLEYVVEGDPKYNTKDHGVPQNRPRIYIIAIQKKSLVRKYLKPQTVPVPLISKFLDPHDPNTDVPGRLPPRTRASQRSHVVRAHQAAKRKGVDVKTQTVVTDHRLSTDRRHSCIGYSPTLTATRAKAGGYWLSTRGRTMSLNEMAKLQGFRGVEGYLAGPRGCGSPCWGSRAHGILHNGYVM
jgi:DNA (cytosine-5)-methyltransferase 1